jgi:hypothetical protein
MIAKQSGVRKRTVVRLESNNQLKKLFIYYETEYCLPLHPINYQNQTMKKNSKKHILLLSASGGLLICLISLYLSRNALLRSIVDKRTSHIEQTHGLRIHYDNLEMNGLNEIILEGLSVVPEQRDTLLTLTSTRVKLNFWKLLSRKIKIRYVAADGITLAFTKRDSVANYDFLFRKKPEYLTRTSPQTAPQTNYAERINKILNLCYGFMPENGQLNNVCITERKNNNLCESVVEL